MMLDVCKKAPSLKTRLNMIYEMSETSAEMSAVSFTALTLYLLGTTTSKRGFLLLQTVTFHSVKTHNWEM